MYPVNKKQQEIRLNITSFINRPVEGSLPNSSTSLKGLIRGVPIGDALGEIEEILKDQNVTDAFRPTGPDGLPAERIILSSSTKIPMRVTKANLSFELQQYFPNPYRCHRCWRLGHTRANCHSKSQACQKCGVSHDQSINCHTRCVNCGCRDHEADSITCPAYIESKNVLRMAITEKISVKEARTCIRSSYSAVAKAGIPHKTV